MDITTSTFLSKFTAREGEARAEPARRQLGRSLALPLVFNRACLEKMFTAIRPLEIITSTLLSEFIVREGEAPAESQRRQLGRSLALPHAFDCVLTCAFSTLATLNKKL